MQNIDHLNDFQVIEFRRYQIKDGGRANFATYFENFFPEAFQQLGALALGQFYEHQAADVREAGLLVTLDAKNNFPQLPVRTDGHYLVWLGIARDDQQLESKFYPLADRAAKDLAVDGLLRSAPELVILDPTKRSRLRWLAE